MRKILFSRKRERTDVRVQPCRFHEDASRFIVAKIVEKTGFLSPMHAHTMYTCDICDHVSKKSIKEKQWTRSKLYINTTSYMLSFLYSLQKLLIIIFFLFFDSIFFISFQIFPISYNKSVLQFNKTITCVFEYIAFYNNNLSNIYLIY